MRLKLIALAIAATAILAQPVAAQFSEQEIIDRYMKKSVKQQKQNKKLYWLSGNYAMNRINKNNDYNNFANYTSAQFPTTDILWLNKANSFGLEFGWMFNKKFALSIGGEYWLKLGQNESGSFTYNPPIGASTTVTELISEIKVYGLTSAVYFYLTNPPSSRNHLTNLAIKLGAGIGFYQVSWNVWDEYENINLSSSLPAAINATFKDSNIGLTLNAGAEYPLNFGSMSLGVDVNYLYLNFNNVAWYNSQDQEVVATYAGDTNSRVDLGLSGVRGRIELKKFFNW
ncbi:MAG: hypothetical protein IIA17_04590 [candidate division Zixibacteria bacterium]|nr:hypothetical protein [candidate division Zixibacteria bacterium]